jgi:hypothetical protein
MNMSFHYCTCAIHRAAYTNTTCIARYARTYSASSPQTLNLRTARGYTWRPPQLISRVRDAFWLHELLGNELTLLATWRRIARLARRLQS